MALGLVTWLLLKRRCDEDLEPRLFATLCCLQSVEFVVPFLKTKMAVC